MSEVTELTDVYEVFDFINESRPAAVDFARRNGCVPCKRLEPHYKAAASKLQDVNFGVVHLDELSAEHFDLLVGEFNLSATPTVLLFAEQTKELKERTAPKLIEEISANI